MTLVEVAVALLLLTIGALALAGGIANGVRARDRALGSALALTAAESWLETWRAARWSAIADSGAAQISWGAREGLVEWRIVPIRPCLIQARVQVTPSGTHRAPIALVTRRFREGVARCEA